MQVFFFLNYRKKWFNINKQGKQLTAEHIGAFIITLLPTEKVIKGQQSCKYIRYFFMLINFFFFFDLIRIFWNAACSRLVT